MIYLFYNYYYEKTLISLVVLVINAFQINELILKAEVYKLNLYKEVIFLACIMKNQKLKYNEYNYIM